MRVLIVDDSPVLRQLLRAILENEGCEVMEAADGEQALAVLARFTPDIVTMDVHMPGMDGYETTAQILERYALPVVVITASANPKDSETAIRALEAGALAVLEKPGGPSVEGFQERVDELLRTLRSMSKVKIVRRSRLAGKVRRKPASEKGDEVAMVPALIVAIAASAGGPVALKSLLQAVQPPWPWPVVIVQHIAAGFMPSFRDWLAGFTPIPVSLAEQDQALAPNQVYLVPDGFHLGFNANRRVFLDDAPPEDYIRPSANYLFRSLARHFGRHTIAIQLSGMGRDGADGLAELFRAGALTLVQEPSSAVIDSMPRAALAVARHVLPPKEIAERLNRLAAQTSPVVQGNKE